MAAAGFDRATICDPLDLGKSLLSRMLSLCAALPLDLFCALGPVPAPGAGAGPTSITSNSSATAAPKAWPHEAR